MSDETRPPADDRPDGEDGRPWWASEDPAGHQSGEGSSHGRHTRPAWLDAVEAIEGAVRAAARGPRRAGGEDQGAPSDAGSGHATANDAGIPDGHRHGAVDAYCHVCPVCALLRALEDVRPEVLLHLTEAAKHLSLAAKAVVDAQADRATGAAGDDFESIPVDD